MATTDPPSLQPSSRRRRRNSQPKQESPPEMETMRESPSERTSMGKILDDNNPEVELLRCGFQPLRKMIIQAENGQREAWYVEAIAPSGAPVFVELDNESYAPAGPRDVVLTQSIKSPLSISEKMGLYELTGGDAHGVMLVCRDGICALTHGDQTPEPVEYNFAYKDAPSDTPLSSLTESPYPIVRLSEIRTNPDSVLKGVRAAIQRSRNGIHGSCASNLSALGKELDELNKSYLKYLETFELKTQQLSEAMEKLEADHATYNPNAPMSEDARRRFVQLVHNIHARHIMAAELINNCHEISGVRSVIAAATNRIRALYVQLAERLQDVDKPLVVDE